MDTIKPCLWFDGQAEQAAEFYVSLFPDSRIDKVTRAPGDNPSTPEGAVLAVEFTLAGRPYQAMNGGPGFPFSMAVSLSVDCTDQAEVDRLWDGFLTGGGKPSQCGWLQDRWGLSWQIVPAALPRLLGDADPDRARRAMQAMMTMTKIDVAALARAADG